MRGVVAVIVLALAVNTFSVAGVSAAQPFRPSATIAPATPSSTHPRILTSAFDVLEPSIAPAPIPGARIGQALDPVLPLDPVTPRTAVHPAAAPRAVSNKPTAAPVSAARTRSDFWGQLHSGLTVRGAASWYPGTGGWLGTAHVAMPLARTLAAGAAAPLVRVCVGGRCLTVPVVDSCACFWDTSAEMLVDLSLPLVRALGLDPSRGIYKVQITLVRG